MGFPAKSALRSTSAGILPVVSRGILGDHLEGGTTETSPERHAANGPPPSRSLLRRTFKLAQASGPIRLLLLRRRLARPDDALRGHLLGRRKHPPGGHRLAFDRHRSREIDDFHPVERPRA